ncbi:MAG: hypothetical protein IT380_02870 [Myxococcales bacterium]|nr:hypothetical protein [Myxococcales bacterium]
MIAPTPERYSARVEELESLRHELEGGNRPGDPGPLVGRVLEAAGDLLRRTEAVKAEGGNVTAVLLLIPEAALKSWSDGVQLPELRTRLQRAASQAVEAAIPDSPEEGEQLAGWAMQDLHARDRLESSLVALEALASNGRGDARVLFERLRRAVEDVDSACRPSAPALSALNGRRRTEAALLDVAHRARAWWYVVRSGIEDDALVQVLGGEAKGRLPPAEKRADGVVTRTRVRRISYDELFRFDLGLATTVEAEVLRRQAAEDAELKRVMAAMEEGERAIEEVTKDDEPPLRSAPVPLPVEPRSSAPEVVEERTEFKVLVFRTKTRVQVVVQPRRTDRFAAAAVFRSDEPERGLPSRSGELGHEFDLGAPEDVAGRTARVVVRLVDGQTHAIEVKL